MQFSLLPGVHTSMTHNDIEDALCLIREKKHNPILCWYLTVSAYIPVSHFRCSSPWTKSTLRSISHLSKSVKVAHISWNTLSCYMTTYLHPANKMAPALSTLIRAFSGGTRWQQPDYKLVIYLIHSLDLEKKTNFSTRCGSTADTLDSLSVMFYWIFRRRIVQATFVWFEERLAWRLKEIRFTAIPETNFWNITTVWWCELDLICALLSSRENMVTQKKSLVSSIWVLF